MSSREGRLRGAGRRRTATRPSAASSSSYGCGPGDSSVTRTGSPERTVAERRNDAGAHERRLAAPARPDHRHEPSAGAGFHETIDDLPHRRRAAEEVRRVRLRECPQVPGTGSAPSSSASGRAPPARDERRARRACRLGERRGAGRLSTRPACSISSASAPGRGRRTAAGRSIRADGRRPRPMAARPRRSRTPRDRRCRPHRRSRWRRRRRRGRPPADARTRARTTPARSTRSARLAIELLTSLGEGPQRRAAQVAPHDVGTAGLAPVVVDRDDVRMLERRDRLRLRLEPLDERLRARDVLVEDLDLDIAPDPRLDRPEPDAGARLAELLQQAGTPGAARLGARANGSCAEDLPVQAHELGRRIDPELVGEDLPTRAGTPRAPRPDALPGRARASAVPRGAPAAGGAPAAARAPRSPAPPTPSRAARRSAPPAPPAAARRAGPPPRAASARRRRRAPARATSRARRRACRSRPSGRRAASSARRARARRTGSRRRRADRRPGRSRAPDPRACPRRGPSGGSTRRSGGCCAPARAARRPRPRRSGCRPARPRSRAPGGWRGRRAASARRAAPGHLPRRPPTGRAHGTAPGDRTQGLVRRARRHRGPGRARSTQIERMRGDILVGSYVAIESTCSAAQGRDAGPDLVAGAAAPLRAVGAVRVAPDRGTGRARSRTSPCSPRPTRSPRRAWSGPPRPDTRKIRSSTRRSGRACTSRRCSSEPTSST